MDNTYAAQAAYAAYGKSTGNKNYQGLEMPTWDKLTPSIQTAWIMAAKAAQLTPQFDWDQLLFKLQTTVTSRKFAALLAALGSTWTLYGNGQINAVIALASTVASLGVYSYSVATEDKKS